MKELKRADRRLLWDNTLLHKRHLETFISWMSEKVRYTYEVYIYIQGVNFNTSYVFTD